MQRTENEYAANLRIYKRPEQQKYTLSRHIESYYVKINYERHQHDTEKKQKQSGVLRLSSVFVVFGVVLISRVVNFHVVRSALQNSVCLHIPRA